MVAVQMWNSWFRLKVNDTDSIMIQYRGIEEKGGDIVAEQKKMLFSKSAYVTIKSTKKVDRLTNTSYDVAARRADERIEKNNRKYAATYKRATLFPAK